VSLPGYLDLRVRYYCRDDLLYELFELFHTILFANKAEGNARSLVIVGRFTVQFDVHKFKCHLNLQQFGLLSKNSSGLLLISAKVMYFAIRIACSTTFRVLGHVALSSRQDCFNGRIRAGIQWPERNKCLRHLSVPDGVLFFA